MKSIKQQYIDLREGKMSQFNFMRNLRMTLPQYVTNVTSFNDAVKILTNKGIISEIKILKELGPDAERMAGNPEEEASYRANLIKRRPSIEDEEDELDALIKKMEDEESGKHTKFNDFEGGLSEENNQDKNDIKWDWNGVFDLDYFEDKNGNNFAANGTVFGDDSEGNSFVAKWMAPVKQGKSTILNDEDIDFNNAKIISSIKPSSPEDSFDGSQFEDEMEKFAELNEAKKKKKKKVEDIKDNPNQFHPQELRMGMKVELEHTDDLDTAKKIAMDHLRENPFYYTEMKLSGLDTEHTTVQKPAAKKVKKKDATEMVDKNNQMQKVKAIKEGLNEDHLNTRDEQIDYILDSGVYAGSMDYLNKQTDEKIKQIYDRVEKEVKGGNIGSSFNKFKSTLEEIVREVLAENK